MRAGRHAAVALAFGFLAPIVPPATIVTAAVPCTISTHLQLGTQSMGVKCLEQRLVELATSSPAGATSR